MSPLTSVVARSFVSGELSPALGARADVTKYIAGLKTCRNLIVQRHGGVTKRPGTKFVAEVKTSSYQPRLVAFEFKAADQNYVLEFGNLYVRFYWHGAMVEDPLNPGDPLEVVTPYATADLPLLQFAQSIDVLTITHPSYAIRELHRVAHDNWTLGSFSIAPTIAAPASPSGSAGTAGALTYKYVITCAKKETYEESVASAVVTITCDTPTPAAPNVLSWTSNGSAAEYYIYADPFQNGVYGYIGTAASNSFRDPGFAPDPTITPPTLKVLFNASGAYPRVGAYWQQRLVFAGSNTNRETVWLSRVGAYHNFSISTPLQDDDALEFIIAGLHLNPVAAVVPLKKLVILSDAGVFLAQGDETGVLRPTAINIDQQGYVGASYTVPPVVVNNGILYVDSSSRVLRDLNFDATQDGFSGQDLSLFASHLFDGYQIERVAYAREPHSIIWVVRSDGTLLGLTYEKEQDVWGWHRHDVDGTVEDVVTLANDDGDDDVYLLVNRTIDGGTVRYIERFGPRFVPNVTAIEDAFFVDCGLTYDSTPATVFSGLDHLEGERVAILGDGAVVSDGRTGTTFTIVTGSVTLPAARSTVQIGLPMPYSDLETLELDVQGTDIRDKEKRVQSLTAIVHQTRHGWKVGPDSSNLIADQANPWDASVTALVDDQSEINMTAGFSTGGRVYIRHDQPLPFTLLGIIPRVEWL